MEISLNDKLKAKSLDILNLLHSLITIIIVIIIPVNISTEYHLISNPPKENKIGFILFTLL